MEKVAVSRAAGEENHKNYIIDYEGLGIISKVIDENYSESINIKLDSSIKKAKNININAAKSLRQNPRPHV